MKGHLYDDSVWDPNSVAFLGEKLTLSLFDIETFYFYIEDDDRASVSIKYMYNIPYKPLQV